MGEEVFRFVLGGLAVSLFAAIGDISKPKSFAGLFGASPAVALTTLALAMSKQGTAYVSADGRSMMAGAAAMFIYCQLAAWLLIRHKTNPLLTTAGCLVAWFGVAFGLYAALLRTHPV